MTITYATYACLAPGQAREVTLLPTLTDLRSSRLSNSFSLVLEFVTVPYPSKELQVHLTPGWFVVRVCHIYNYIKR